MRELVPVLSDGNVEDTHFQAAIDVVKNKLIVTFFSFFLSHFRNRLQS